MLIGPPLGRRLCQTGLSVLLLLPLVVVLPVLLRLLLYSDVKRRAFELKPKPYYIETDTLVSYLS